MTPIERAEKIASQLDSNREYFRDLITVQIEAAQREANSIGFKAGVISGKEEGFRAGRLSMREEAKGIAQDHHHDMMCHDTHQNEVCAIAQRIGELEVCK